MNKKTVRDVSLAGKRVLLRVDFNVPLDAGEITDDTRIQAAAPTIRYILDRDPRSVILMSHLGRPKGQRVPELSLAPVAQALSALLGVDVAFADDCVGQLLQTRSRRCRRAASCCSRIRASMPAKQRTTANSRERSRLTAISIRQRRLWYGPSRARIKCRRGVASGGSGGLAA